MLTDTATTTINGPGANLLTVSGGGKSRVFDIDGASAVLSGLTITGGSAESGGGLFNTGWAALTDVIIRGNKTLVGSGMFNTRRATRTWRRSPAGRR